MTSESWRSILLRRLGWSLGASSLWTWGLLLLRLPRDGWQPLDVWFSYGLSFLMTAVYVYLGLLIYATVRAEGRQKDGDAAKPADPAVIRSLGRIRKPVSVIGVIGLLVAVASIGGWLLWRFPGPQAMQGTSASILLAFMIFGVAVIATFIAHGASASGVGRGDERSRAGD